MTYESVSISVAEFGLSLLGGFPTPDWSGHLAPGQTLLLLGPSEGGFWDHVRQQEEFLDAAPDPLDRWSRRTITALAAHYGGQAYFPFGGPPHRPFHRWALQSGRCWNSPVGLLVHDRRGLFVSFRGAITLPSIIDVPATANRPCDSCPNTPCLTACPIDAFGDDAYDVDACSDHVASPTGSDCLTSGCRVRRSCPLEDGSIMAAEQRRFHQEAFLRR